MQETEVDKLYNSFKETLEFLDKNKQPSYYNTANDNFRKTLSIAIASYFEVRIKSIIKNFIKKSTNNNELILEFLINKAIARQYHTYFAWKETNKPANDFFGLFGKNFKKHMDSQRKKIPDFKQNEQSFTEIGRVRNGLAHEEFFSNMTNKTSEELYNEYKKALKFVEIFEKEIFNYHDDKD